MIDVKKIYMDLNEAKSEQRWWKDVRVLESEAFKDPITLQIEYSDHDKEWIKASKEWLMKQVGDVHKVLQNIEGKEDERKQLISKYKESMKVKDQKIEELTKRLEKSGKEKVQLLKEAKNDREMINNLNEQLTTLKETLNEIKQKVTKEPRVFNGQTFISWNWYSVLTTAHVPNGNYILSSVTKIVEKNEYVENEDVEVGAYNLHVADGLFMPEFELRGTTNIDMPTATVNRTFTLLPY